MKTNYTRNGKQAFFYMFLTILFACSVSVNAQTYVSVFSDNFDRGETTTPVSAGGVPEMSWTSVTTSTGAGTGAKTQAALIPDAVEDYALRIYPGNSTDGQTAGRTYAYGTLSTYTTPFQSKLTDNSNQITWTFSFRTNRNTAFSGFDANQYGMAVILASNGSDFLTADGYAVILNRHASTSPKNAVSLVKFTSGLNLNTNVTTIIGPSSTETTDDLRIWFNVKVVFTPSTSTWELFVRKQATGGYTDKGDPLTVNTIVGAATVDNTYTGTSMTHCGFLYNHSAVSSANVNSNTVYIDDFKVAILDQSTSIPQQGFTGVKVYNEGNNISIKGAKNIEYMIYNISGQMIVNGIIQNDNESLTLSRGMYLIKLGNNRFKVFVK